MAIDYGDARTGVAVSDPTGFLAGFTSVIPSRRPEQAAAEISALAREHGVEELVVGHPRNMDGSLGPRAEKAEAFADLLRSVTGLPVALWDERRTTVDAWQILHAGGKTVKKGKRTVDAVAASLILEGYLAYRKNQQ